MSAILIGRPQFNDWVQAIDALARGSDGALVMRELVDVDELIGFAKRNGVTAIVPTTYPQMRLLAQHYQRLFDKGLTPLCPSRFELVETFDDKVRFARFMEEQSLEHLVPTTYLTQERGHRVQHAPVAYPCIYKLAVGFGGTGSAVHLDPARPLDPSRLQREIDYIVQELIPGPVEYGAHYFVLHGEVRHAIYYRSSRDPSLFVQRGRMQRYERHDTVDGASDLEDIFGRLDYTGFACIDFKIVDGVPRIFEINPRLGGTLVHDPDDLRELLDAALAAC